MPKAKAQPVVQATAKAKPVAKPPAKAQAVTKTAKPATKVQATPKVANKISPISQTTSKSTKSQKAAEVVKKRTPAGKKMEATTPIIKEASQKIKKDAKSKPPTKPPSPKKEETRPSAQPKRPASAYQFFNSEMQAQMKSMEKFKGLGFGERIKVVSESWSKLNEEQKSEYVKRSEDDKKRQERELKQIEKKGFFKDKDGKDSRDLYKPAKEKKSGEAQQGTQKSVSRSKSKSPEKILAEKEKAKAKKDRERERAKKLKEKEKLQQKKLKEKELKLKKKELLHDDRARPKNVMGAYFHFYLESAKKYPDFSMCEISKKTGEDWKKLSDDQKKKYESLKLKDGVRFEREMKEFNEKGFFTNSDGIKSTFLKKKTHQVMEFERGTVMPKRVLVSVRIFFNQQHDILKAQIPEDQRDKKYSPFDHYKELGEKWRAMTDKEKEKFDKLAEKDKERYEKEMAALRKNGFFVNQEGIKSTDLPPPVYKPIKMKKKRTTKSTVVEEQPVE